MHPQLGPTEQAIVERLAFGMTAQEYQEYQTLLLIIAVGALALVIIFWTLVYLNRDALRRRFRDWLNK
jgi:hypothetical protein